MKIKVNKYDAQLKVKKVIESCQDLLHIVAVKQLIRNYKNMYGIDYTDPLHFELVVAADIKRDSIRNEQ
jgi:hypothetical protein